MVRDSPISYNASVSLISHHRFIPSVCHDFAHLQSIQGPAHPPGFCGSEHSFWWRQLGLSTLKPLFDSLLFYYYAVWATVIATLVFYCEMLRIGLRRPQSLTALITARLCLCFVSALSRRHFCLLALRCGAKNALAAA